MKVEPPVGFVLLAVFLALKALSAFILFLPTVPDPVTFAALVERVLALGAMALAGVAAVALMRVERWAGTAVTALAALLLVRLFVPDVGWLARDGSLTALLLYGGAMALPVVYVRTQLETLYPGPSGHLSFFPRRPATAVPFIPLRIAARIFRRA
jgi:hypothetical protein